MYIDDILYMAYDYGILFVHCLRNNIVLYKGTPTWDLWSFLFLPFRTCQWLFWNTYLAVALSQNTKTKLGNWGVSGVL